MLLHRVALEDQDLNNEFSELVVGFLELFSNVSRFKGTNIFISSSKEGTGSPRHFMAIEMHKILSMDAPSQIPIEDEALGDHALNILEHSSQAKECNWGWFVAPLSTLAKEGEQEDEDGASILNC